MVELSIVLVIIGLLTGGILSGQSLIRAAELRKIPTSLASSESAISTFRSKYFYLPGDMPNATQFWSRQYNSSDCPTNYGTPIQSNGTCDGNGDGLISGIDGDVVVDRDERYWMWRQLALSGLIPGTYSGTFEGGHYEIPGKNVPALWGLSGYTFRYFQPGGDSIYSFPTPGGHSFTFGTMSPSSGFLDYAITSVEETWSLDQKIDDGHARSGRMRIKANHSWNDGCMDSENSNYNFSLGGNISTSSRGPGCYFLVFSN